VAFRAAAAGTSSPCDLNSDQATNVVDVQLITNMVLGTRQCTANIAGPGVCNSDVHQRVVTAALGGTCVTTSAPTYRVNLTWVASTGSSVTGYNIYRATATGGPWTRLNSGLIPSTSFADTSVQSGQAYYYVATAVNSSGSESTYSNQASAVIP
jgi:hypothetical protein